MMREYTVFNVDQCESLPDRVLTLGEIKPRNLDERDAAIDEFLASSGATIREGYGEAYYRPGGLRTICAALCCATSNRQWQRERCLRHRPGGVEAGVLIQVGRRRQPPARVTLAQRGPRGHRGTVRQQKASYHVPPRRHHDTSPIRCCAGKALPVRIRVREGPMCQPSTGATVFIRRSSGPTFDRQAAARFDRVGRVDV
jgi:hypothetical protein